jgi:hypothetical protein
MVSASLSPIARTGSAGLKAIAYVPPGLAISLRLTGLTRSAMSQMVVPSLAATRIRLSALNAKSEAAGFRPCSSLESWVGSVGSDTSQRVANPRWEAMSPVTRVRPSGLNATEE